MTDEPIRPDAVTIAAPGLEGMPRSDMALLETTVPKLVDMALRGPVVLTRHGSEAFALVPLDVWRRVWGATSRPPLIRATRSD